MKIKPPALRAADESGRIWELPQEGERVLLWFNPIFQKFGCKPCQDSLIHERYPDLRKAGIIPLCATYDSAEVNARRNEKHFWSVPILTVDQSQAAGWGALRGDNDAWRDYTPMSVAYFIDEKGFVVRSWVRPAIETFVEEVISFAKYHSLIYGGTESVLSPVS